MGRKRFIDKKNAQHFQLVHRSRDDPLCDEEDTTPLVLEPVIQKDQLNGCSKFKLGDLDERFVDENHRSTKHFKPNQEEERIGEAALYGIYYDESEYDYMQHLKNMGAPGAIYIEAGSTNKEKEKEKEILGKVIKFKEEGEKQVKQCTNPEKEEEPNHIEDLLKVRKADTDLLREAVGPDELEIPEGDADMQQLLEAMEDDAYVVSDDDEFEDLLYEMDGGSETSDKDYDMLETEYQNDEELLNSMIKMSAGDKPRNEQLQLLDKRFEQIEKAYESEMDDEEMDMDEPLTRESNAFLRAKETLTLVVDEFIEQSQIVGRKVEPVYCKGDSIKQLDEIRQSLKEGLNSSMLAGKDDPEIELVDSRKVHGDKENMWDCESVLSTYSNIYNHPSLIRESSREKIKIDKRSGMPVLETLREEEEEQSDSDEEKVNKGAPRNKKESKEEKRLRKQAIKNDRKERREEKKSTKHAYKLHSSCLAKTSSGTKGLSGAHILKI